MRFYRIDKFLDLRLKTDLVAVSIYDTEVGDLVKIRYFNTLEDGVNWAESQVNF